MAERLSGWHQRTESDLVGKVVKTHKDFLMVVWPGGAEEVALLD